MSDGPATRTLRVDGMTCGGCARSIEAGVARLEGVESCEVQFATGTLHLRGDVPVARVTARVEELGFGIRDAGVGSGEPGEPGAAGPRGALRSLAARPETRRAGLALLLLLPGLVYTELLGRDAPLVSLLALGALLLAGLPVARDGLRSLRAGGGLGIRMLMTIASLGALALGHWVEGAMVMTLFVLGEALEALSAERAREAILGMGDLLPETATRVGPDGAQEVLPLSALTPGDRVLVRPAERVPADGLVRRGRSALDEGPITGEARPRDRAPGDEVYAGSVNGEGALVVEVTRPASDSTLERMARLVEDAQASRAPLERTMDRFARRYTPAVLLGAAAVALLPPLLLGQPWLGAAEAEASGWLYRGLALLVVACPCALVLSTPVTIASAIANGARHGLLVKGGAQLEALGRVRSMALDKTGTLTEGRPEVVSLRASDCATASDSASACCPPCQELLALAGVVEAQSEHPLARAVIAAASASGLVAGRPAASEVRAVPGRGVTAAVAGRRVDVGSHPWFDARVPHAPQHCEAARADAARGWTPLLVSVDGGYRGTITLADRPRESAREAIAALREMGVAPIVMLTGDSPEAARTVAEAVEIDELRAGLLPEDKLRAVEAMRDEAGPVAMVGDGINDTPALAAADLGIAIGGAPGATGTARAMETADVTLLSDDLRRLPYALRLGRAALRRVRWNIAISIGVKALVAALVLAGSGTMWLAVLADVGTSLLVTANGLRLLRRPLP